MRAGRSSCGGIEGAAQTPSRGAAKGLRVCAVVLAAATLAACAQSSVVNDRSAAVAVQQPAASRQAMHSPQAPSTRIASSIIHRRAAVAKRHKPAESAKPAGDTEESMNGVASFYNQGTQTANGEKFDPSELTAAHRTLPFGTRLRVTNVATGQSVTVRINDRGPFIPGRHVDLSQGAAETLGIVHRGIAKVKLDVLE